MYCREDPEVMKLAGTIETDIKKIPYGLPEFSLDYGQVLLHHPEGKVPLSVFGRHNMMNLMGAMEICRLMGVEDRVFLEAIQSFKGAANRLEFVNGNETACVFKDFAHAPSKVKATVEAMAERAPGRTLIACLELHTFSSLSKAFLPQYAGVMDSAAVPIVYFNEHALALKKLPPLNPEDIRAAFGRDDLLVYHDSAKLWQKIMELAGNKPANLLLMSSGNFDGMNIAELANQFIS